MSTKFANFTAHSHFKDTVYHTHLPVKATWLDDKIKYATPIIRDQKFAPLPL